MKPTQLIGAAALAFAALPGAASAQDAPVCNTARAETLSFGASIERS